MHFQTDDEFTENTWKQSRALNDKDAGFLEKYAFVSQSVDLTEAGIWKLVTDISVCISGMKNECIWIQISHRFCQWGTINNNTGLISEAFVWQSEQTTGQFLSNLCWMSLMHHHVTGCNALSLQNGTWECCDKPYLDSQIESGETCCARQISKSISPRYTVKLHTFHRTCLQMWQMVNFRNPSHYIEKIHLAYIELTFIM